MLPLLAFLFCDCLWLDVSWDLILLPLTGWRHPPSSNLFTWNPGGSRFNYWHFVSTSRAQLLDLVGGAFAVEGLQTLEGKQSFGWSS
jgi:hypothetical protein